MRWHRDGIARRQHAAPDRHAAWRSASPRKVARRSRILHAPKLLLWLFRESAHGIAYEPGDCEPEDQGVHVGLTMLDWRKASRLRVDVVRHRKSSYETTVDSLGFSHEKPGRRTSSSYGAASSRYFRKTSSYTAIQLLRAHRPRRTNVTQIRIRYVEHVLVDAVARTAVGP